MKAIATFALLILVLLPQAALACPTGAPDARQFHITASRACTAAQPCLTTDTLAFDLVKNEVCYPSWYGCPGYTIQACDLVTWDFGDGSAPVNVSGKSSVTHQFAPGHHVIHVRVTNARGSAELVHELHIGMSPAAFVTFDKSSYTYGEGDGVATVKIVRRGNLARRIPLVVQTSGSALFPTRSDIAFEPGETSKTLAFPIVDDTTRHAWYPDTVILSQEGGEAILDYGYGATTNVAIVDNDPQVIVTPVLEQRTYTEPQDTLPVHVGIRLSAPQSDPVRLIATVWDVNSTASWGSDWRAQWTEIEIPPGKTEASYEVELLGDSIAEKTESLVIYLGPSTSPLDPAPAFEGWPLTLTILDDDSPAPAPSAKMNPSVVNMRVGERAQAFIATQASPQSRIVSFTSSNPQVAYLMMPEQTMLAGATAMPFTIDVHMPGTATIVGRFADGLSASLVVHVEGSAPQLPDLAFAPGFLDLDAGATKPMIIRAGNVTNAPRIVTLTPSKTSIITAPAIVTIPAGASEASFDVTGRAAGTLTLTANIDDGRTTIIAVKVTAPLPTFAISTPGTVRIGATQTSTLTLTPASKAKVTLKASRSGIVTIPASLTLAANGTAALAIKGMKSGTVDIAATTKVGTKTYTAKTTVTVTKK